MSFPSASVIESKTESKIESKTESKTEKMEIETLLACLRNLETVDLYKVIKLAITETEKRSKPTKAKTEKKAGSMPKGEVPSQLKKPRKWVEFTLKHALENGWESFTVHQKKTDKETGAKTIEEIEMPGSIMFDGAHVYEGSITEKTPKGKQLIHKDAMSLSKQRWTPKTSEGTNQELYEEFESNYVEEETVATQVVKISAADKVAIAEAKKLAKEQEKAEKKMEKEREKEAKKLEKKAKVPSAAIAKPKKIVEAKQVVLAAPVAAVAAAPAPVVPVKTEKKRVQKVEKVEKVVEIPADGMVHPWQYKGKHYVRNSDNEVWLRGTDGGCGEWQGIYMPGEDRIDDSVAEPEFEDE